MKIVLLYGGISAERDVSIDSATSIYNMIKNDYSIEKFDFQGNYEKLLIDLDSFNPNVVFNALHGGDGENGKMQKFLGKNNFNFTGSDEKSSRIAMDKNKTKIICLENDIPTPDWDYLDGNNVEMEDKSIDVLVDKYNNFGCVVKPSEEGSSIGMTIINKEKVDFDILSSAIKRCRKFSKKIIIEKFIKGRELTCGILGKESLPLVEIIPNNDFYDYNCKYTKGMSSYIVPPNLSNDISTKIKNFSEEIHLLIGCQHYSRVDYRLDGDNIYLLEINTLPGLTSTSLLPKAAASKNINYKQLVKKIINLSL